MESSEGCRLSFAKRVKLVEPSAIREILKYVDKPDVISFAGGLPDPQTFPVKEVEDACREVLEEKPHVALQYARTEGVEELRRELIDFMIRRGVLSKMRDDEDLLITSGSQEALFLIAHALIDPGDLVITERPTYLAMLQILCDHEARVVGVDIDENGLDTYKLEDKLRELTSQGAKPKIIYVVPTCQNPTGVTMSMDRRKHLLELAEKYDLLIVEDDPYSYYLYEPVNVKPLKYLDETGRVVYVSTFSKILAPGFRLGWIVGPRELIREMVKLKQVLSLQTATFTQYVAARLLRKRVIDNRLPLIAEYYRKKRDIMLDALETFLSSYAEWTRPVGGMFVWVRLRKNIDTKKLLPLAVEKYKVAYVPGEPFYPERPEVNTLRLNFTYPDVNKIREGIARLAKLVHEVS